MPTVTRLFEGGSRQVDSTTGVSEIRYLVSDVTRGLDDPLAFLPQPGSPHPDSFDAANGLRIDRLEEVGWIDSNTVFCRAVSSADGRGRLPPRIPVDDPLFEDWAFTSSRTTHRVPRYVRKQEVVPQPDQGGQPQPPVTKFRWDPEPWDEPTREFGLIRTVNVTTFSSSDLSLIESRQGQLHSFFGRLWRYEIGTSRLVANGVWQIQYNWVRPAPMPAFGQGPGYPVVKDADGLPFSTLDIVVPPFELQPFDEYGVIPGATFEDPPQFVAERRGDRTNTGGHNGLPGNPI